MTLNQDRFSAILSFLLSPGGYCLFTLSLPFPHIFLYPCTKFFFLQFLFSFIFSRLPGSLSFLTPPTLYFLSCFLDLLQKTAIPSFAFSKYFLFSEIFPSHFLPLLSLSFLYLCVSRPRPSADRWAGRRGWAGVALQ